MAGFSQKYHPFFKDSSSDFPPTSSSIKMLGFLEEPNKNCIQVYQPEPLDDFPDNVCVHETSACSPQGTKVISNETTVSTKIKCPKSSPSSYKVETTVLKQDSQLLHSPIHNKKIKNKEVPSSISSQSNKNNMEEMKAKKQKKEMKKDKKKATEEIPNGYIHVRARRGQATDSHSLAERVRREKISERMKILQGLVPGCDKVNGKALMLDEIINYVQSLQHQVEFLSMKLATVNPMYYDFGMDIDTSMVSNEQRLNDYLVSPRPLPPPPPSSMQPCNATHQIPVPNSTSAPSSSIFGFLDNSASSLPIEQELFPNISPRGSGQLLWDFDEQIIQKLVNQQLSEFPSY